MGSKLESGNLCAHRAHRDASDEIAVFAAFGGPADTGSAELRRRLVPDVPARTWHRVFPFLPKERREGGIVVWHPVGDDWARSLERVHAGRTIRWRRSGAYLQWPGIERLVPTDLAAFDDLEISDWSLAVPDARFRALCARCGEGAQRLSEVVARWALEAGPRVAGAALCVCLALEPAAADVFRSR